VAISRICDIASCGQSANYTVRFTADGSPELEIDLCAEHGADLPAWVAAGRQPEGKRRYRQYATRSYTNRDN